MLAGLCVVFGFAMIWHMWLVVCLAFIALLAVAIGHTFNYKRDFHIPADEVARIEAARTTLLANHV
jgi:cytochrome o ubiquinol oxidase subunit 1